MRAILNYTPLDLNLPPAIIVENVDPVIHLQRMTFRLRQPSWPLANGSAEIHRADSEVAGKARRKCIVHIKRKQPIAALPTIHNGLS